jgi:uncharacterized protein (DUF2141 family)
MAFVDSVNHDTYNGRHCQQVRAWGANSFIGSDIQIFLSTLVISIYSHSIHKFFLLRRILRSRLAPALACLTMTAALSADLSVIITGIEDAKAEVGCTLFSKPDGFPMDVSAAKQQWLPVNPSGTTCRFTGLPDGSYAVSIGIDQNKNRKVDTNFLGMPTEQWGVSNNVRPSLRAPRFEEAAFKIQDDKDLNLQIKVAK